MERFHFNTKNGHRLDDPDGNLLPDVAAAKIAAVQYLADMLSNHAELFWETEAYSVIVTDDEGLTLFTLDLNAFMSPALSPH